MYKKCNWTRESMYLTYWKMMANLKLDFNKNHVREWMVERHVSYDNVVEVKRCSLVEENEEHARCSRAIHHGEGINQLVRWLESLSTLGPKMIDQFGDNDRSCQWWKALGVLVKKAINCFVRDNRYLPRKL